MIRQKIISIGQNEKIVYLFIYTILFFVIFFAWCTPFFFGTHSFLRDGDAISQHYPALVYIGEYIREFFRNLFAGTPSLPMYDFSIGMGDDIMAPLLVHSTNAGIGNLLFAIFPAASSLMAYIVLITLRLYAAGLAFSYFGFTVLKSDKRFVLIGSLIYTFSGWSLMYSFRHISFILPLIYLPLIIAGFDMILRGKKPFLFIISVFFMALASFYFLYMITIFLLFYALIRIYILYSESYFKSILHYGLKSVGFYIAGIMMSAVTFIPILAVHLGGNREPHINTESLWFFSFQDYLNMLTSFSSVESFSNFWTLSTGMVVIASVSIVLLLVNKQIKHRKYLLIAIGLVFLFSWIPFGSFLLNGFGYVTNRCDFLFAFVFAIITVCVMPYIVDTKPSKQLKKNAIASAVYAGILLAAIIANPESTLLILVGFGLVLGIILILLLPVDIPSLRFFKTERAKTNCIICFVVINLAYNAFTFQGVNLTYNQDNDYLHDVIKVSDYVDDNSFFREHRPFKLKEHEIVNLAMLNDYNGISAYWSLVNTAYQDFVTNLEISEQLYMEWRVYGFDDRTALNAVSAVKYYTAAQDDVIPFGFAEYTATDSNHIIYRNKYALPLGFTYTKAISADEYDRLDALDKQTVLLQAAVLPAEYACPNIDISSLLNKIEIPHTMTLIEEDENEKTVFIAFEGLANSETYIRLTDVGIHGKFHNSLVNIASNNVNKSMRISNYDQIIRRDNHLINLGYSEQAPTYATIIFNGITKNYTVGGIEVYSLPMDDFPEWIEALREDVLENIKIGTNKVTGDITLEQEKVLVLSIPYSDGWSATVNGEQRELLKANHMFMALPLDEGFHSIVLTYQTPGLSSGVVVSIIGMLVFAGICMFYKKRKI
jgi:uncharacterized membrane protein YfhO